MQYTTTLANIQMPKLIYGTAWKKERTADLVFQAIQAGFRGVDTAGQPKHYNEALVGDGLRQAVASGVKRQDIFLQTKFTPLDGQDPERTPYDRSEPVDIQIHQSFSRSKKNLQTDYIDSLILHSPLRTHQQLRKAWRAMEDIFEQGEALQLGISNCYDLEVLQRLVEDARICPAVVQNRFYQQTGYDKRLRDWCTAQGIWYQSFWTLTANPHILESASVQNLCRKYEKTAAQIYFRFLTQSGITVLTGTTSAEHMREDLAIFTFSLGREDLQKLEGLLTLSP